MGNTLAKQRFGSYEDVKKRLDEWFAAKRDVVFTNCPKDGKNVQRAMDHILTKSTFMCLRNLTFF